MDKIIDFLRMNGIGWIGLIAEPGTQAFYQWLGFESMAGYSPMLLNKKRTGPCVN
jgi:hypothetical protein